MQNITVFSILDHFYVHNKENRTTGYHKLLYLYMHNNGINFTCGPHKSEGEQFSPSIHSYHSIESLLRSTSTGSRAIVHPSYLFLDTNLGSDLLRILTIRILDC